MNSSKMLMVLAFLSQTSIFFGQTINGTVSFGVTGGYTDVFPSEKISVGLRLEDFLSIESMFKLSPRVFQAGEGGLILRGFITDFIIDNRLVWIDYPDKSYLTYSGGLGIQVPFRLSETQPQEVKTGISFVLGATIYDVANHGNYAHPVWSGYNYFPIYADISWYLYGPWFNL